VLKRDETIFAIATVPIILILSIACLMPFIVILSSSLTAEQSIVRDGYRFFPKVVSVEAYKLIFSNSKEVLNAYGVSLSITIVGTLIGVFLSSMTAYVLSSKSFDFANKFSFFFYFTTIFSGGLVPWYILCVQYLKFKQLPFIALVLPGLFSVWNILILRNFMKTIPESIVESAKLDGAKEFNVFIKLVLPLSKPALATIGLLMALAYWNDWYSSFLFVDNPDYYSLQYFLYKMISALNGIQRMAKASGNYISTASLPSEGFKMAITVITTVPILLLYPFLQKYFIRGITIGAVKG
jgi:putative aldouronate transport system permease protein